MGQPQNTWRHKERTAEPAYSRVLNIQQAEYSLFSSSLSEDGMPRHDDYCTGDCDDCDDYDALPRVQNGSASSFVLRLVILPIC